MASKVYIFGNGVITVRQNVEHKIKLWYEVNGYINQIEGSYHSFFTALIALFGIVIAALGTKIIPEHAIQVRIFILIFTPAAIASTVAFLAYNIRWVAMARNYASKLEAEINHELGEDIFLWNGRLVDKCMAKSSANLVVFSCNLLFFLFVWFVLNYYMWIIPISVAAKCIYTALLTIIPALCLLPFAGNERVRKMPLEDEK